MFFWQNTRQATSQELQADFERQTSELIDSLEKELATHELLLRGVEGLFKASGHVARNDFRRYYQALQLNARSSGFTALAYHETVFEKNLEQHLAMIRREGFPDYRVVPEGKRERYAPMLYIEPFEGANRTVLGFDPLTVDAEREAVELARDTGSVTISGKLVLAQDGGEKAPGFVMYVPLYRNNSATTSKALRQENFIGWVDTPYRMSELILRVLPSGLEAIDFEIFDGTTKSTASVLYDSDRSGSFEDDESSGYKVDRLFKFGGRIWTLSFRSLPEFGSSAVRHKADLVAATGGLLSVLLSLLIALGIRTQRRRMRAALRQLKEAEAEVHEQERQKNEQLLRESESRFRLVMEDIPSIAVQGYLLDGTVSFWNKASELLYGYSAEEALGANLLDLIIPPEMRDGVAEAMQQMLRTGIPIPAGELLLKTKTNARVPVFSSHALVHKINGKTELFCLDIDLTERKAAEDQLRKLSLAVDQSPSSIVIANINAEIEYVNDAFVQNTGYSREEAFGQNPRILQSGRNSRDFYLEMWRVLTQGQAWKGELHNKRKDGTDYTEFAVIAPLRQPNGQITHYVGVKDDITARRAAEDEANTLAFFDPLTHLPNRRLLIDRLERAIARFERSKNCGALLLIDLDNFKTLNDTLGHDIGDLLLQQVAQRLTANIREGDTVSRFGGDEFVLILENLSKYPQIAASQAQLTGEMILSILKRPYDLSGNSHSSTPSIGLTLFAPDQKIEEILKQVELAMYQAKSAGRGVLRFFDPEMQKTVSTRAELEADLREAISKGQFSLYYQAQVTSDDRLIGAEVLLRWQHPVRKMVSPAEFIPLAEDSGMILPIGHWVLQTACAQLALWANQPGMSHLTLAVNVSARQFKQPDFIQEVLSILEHFGANPKRLKLELTENMLVDDVEDMIVKMSALRAKGVSFSLDDFGTGYSSLSYLKRLPLDQLKIDQGFVRDILTDPNDAAIARTIIALGESLGIGVIAEGVELEAQKDFLARHGCHAYQGYFFSRPLPLEDFRLFVKQVLPKVNDSSGWVI
ncbi:MAG: EAL domain-containing protein [Betaproteobacteria bacterium]